MGATDLDLLSAYSRQRDERAFEALVQRHGPLVWGVLRRRLAQAADVEDAFQSVFLALARRAPSLLRPGELSSWLFAAAIRVSEAQYRQRRRQIELKGLASAQSTAPDQPASALSADLRVILDREIVKLPWKLRQAFVLCALQGFGYVEAAAEVNCSVAAIRGRLYQARGRLRSRLARLGLGALALVPDQALSGLDPEVPADLAESTTQLVRQQASPSLAQTVRGLAARFQLGPCLLAATVGLISCLLFAIVAAPTSQSSQALWGTGNLVSAPEAGAGGAVEGPAGLAPDEPMGGGVAPTPAADGGSVAPRGERVSEGTVNLLQVGGLELWDLPLEEALDRLRARFKVGIECSAMARARLGEARVTLGPGLLDLTGIEILQALATRTRTRLEILDGVVVLADPGEIPPKSSPAPAPVEPSLVEEF